MQRGALLVVVLFGLALSLLATSGTAWAATNWVVHVATTNSGEAHAQALPAAPASPAAACTSPASTKTVKVSWSAVTHATAYAVYESTTTATGTYTLVMSGVTATSWTTGVLGDRQLLVRGAGRRRLQLGQRQVDGDRGDAPSAARPAASPGSTSLASPVGGRPGRRRADC